MNKLSFKVLISTPLNNVTGYGLDGIGVINAFIHLGADVYIDVSCVRAPIPPQIAVLLTKPIPSEVDLLISHRCPQELSLITQNGAITNATVSIAWSMWEWTSLDIVDVITETNCEHQSRLQNTLATSLSRFDALLAYDNVSYSALSPYHKNTQVLQGGFSPAQWRPVERDWSKPLQFAMCGMLTATRKQPWLAIEAFNSLQEEGYLEGSTLELHTLAPGLHPGMMEHYPNIKISYEIWSQKRLAAFYASKHVLLAPSRGEGKNLAAMEMATTGGVVVATNAGGHAMWLSSQFGYPLDYKWVAEPNLPKCKSAQVSVEHLRQTMLHIDANRAEAAQRGQLAAQIVPQMCAWDRVVERLIDKLPALVPGHGGGSGRGDYVRNLALMCRQEPDSLIESEGFQRSVFDQVMGGV